MKGLDELKKLNLPSDKYAVFGSGVLARHGIRENRDLDIIVKQELYSELSKNPNFSPKEGGGFKRGDIEILMDYSPETKFFDYLIDSAELIDGIRYVQLEEILKWKEAERREKDLRDIELIKKYLAKSEIIDETNNINA